MSEPKPIYETGDYWQIVAEQERKKSASNLRLAAERASEIAELKQELEKKNRLVDDLIVMLTEIRNKVAQAVSDDS